MNVVEKTTQISCGLFNKHILSDIIILIHSKHILSFFGTQLTNTAQILAGMTQWRGGCDLSTLNF